MAATVLFNGSNETVTLTNTFFLNLVATDPGTIALTVLDPQGGTTTYTFAGAQITRTSAGVYWKEVATPLAGEWQFTWTGTSPVADVQHDSFTVWETNLGRLYASPAAIKSRVGITATDATKDYELQGACYAASRAIENACSRTFYRLTDVREFGTDDLWSIDLGEYNDLVSVTTLKVDGDGDGVFETTVASTDYQLLPRNLAGPEIRPYTSIKRLIGSWPITYWPQARVERIQITGVYGWPTVPSGITEAAKVLAAELFKMKDAPFGVASFGELGAIRVRQNPIIEDLIQPYKHGTGGYAV